MSLAIPTPRLRLSTAPVHHTLMVGTILPPEPLHPTAPRLALMLLAVHGLGRIYTARTAGLFARMLNAVRTRIALVLAVGKLTVVRAAIGARHVVLTQVAEARARGPGAAAMALAEALGVARDERCAVRALARVQAAVGACGVFGVAAAVVVAAVVVAELEVFPVPSEALVFAAGKGAKIWSTQD